MNDKFNRKRRMEELLLKNKMNRKKEYGTLFNECLEALKKDVCVLSDIESEEIYENLQNDFPFVSWGRIDWDKLDNRFEVRDTLEIIPYIQTDFIIQNDLVYILWGYGNYPVIRTNLKSTMRVIENINAIGGDQWIYSPHNKYVIEFHHEGEILIGHLI